MHRRRSHPTSLFPRAQGLALLGLAALAAFAPIDPAQAQMDDTSAAAYWRRERELMQARQRAIQQRPTRMIRGAAPRQGFAREAETGGLRPPLIAPPAAPLTGETHTPTPNGPAEAATSAPVGPSFVIAVLGDNVGLFLAQGLQEAFADRGSVTILRKARENTGLVRDDYFDWPKAARELLASGQKINAAVMLVGSNDRQSLREGLQNHDPRTPRWRELYVARAQAFADAFREKDVPLIWVGAPVMQNERLAGGLLELNEIYREAAERAGATYVDTWEGFVDDRHRYAVFGPDVNGLTTRLRTSDGVHFTRAGARKLAYFTEGDLRRLMERAAPTPAALPDALIPAPTPGAPDARKPEPAATPAPAPARPDRGPISPLTGAAASAGGELVRPLRPDDPVRDREARAIVERNLVNGAPGEPPAGRADDFRWPRP